MKIKPPKFLICVNPLVDKENNTFYVLTTGKTYSLFAVRLSGNVLNKEAYIFAYVDYNNDLNFYEIYSLFQSDNLDSNKLMSRLSDWLFAFFKNKENDEAKKLCDANKNYKGLKIIILNEIQEWENNSILYYALYNGKLIEAKGLEELKIEIIKVFAIDLINQKIYTNHLSYRNIIPTVY